MPYLVRPMQLEDIPQVAGIDREAFPTEWPVTSFKRELNNKLAHYLVVEERGGDEPALLAPEGPGAAVEPTEPRGLISRLRRLLDRGQPQPGSHRPIVGFAGFWLMFDEAHLTTIAVRHSHRRRGIGELMLIAVIEKALQLHAQVVTLEVRVSNLEAQVLYRKYGFNQTGVRRGYYSDNHEDALIMTTENITTNSCQARFQQLQQAYRQRWGADLRPILL